MRAAKELARRYRLAHTSISCRHDGESPIDYDSFTAGSCRPDGPAPVRASPQRRASGCASPWQIRPIWSVSTSWPDALRTRVIPYVATAGAIDIVLRRGDTTQRVLQEAASGFRISLVRETEAGEEVLDLDRLATDSDMSPIIKLVDTIIYNAMESRASDIHYRDPGHRSAGQQVPHRRRALRQGRSD